MTLRRLESRRIEWLPSGRAKVADAVGIPDVRIETAQDVKRILAEALSQNGPVVIDVVTNPKGLALPPRIQAKEVAG